MHLVDRESRFDINGVISSIAQNNPHISLSDIAFLMGVPYKPEPSAFEHEFDDDQDDAAKEEALRSV